jgi:hypothetical protein
MVKKEKVKVVDPNIAWDIVNPSPRSNRRPVGGGGNAGSDTGSAPATGASRRDVDDRRRTACPCQALAGGAKAEGTMEAEDAADAAPAPTKRDVTIQEEEEAEPARKRPYHGYKLRKRNRRD